MNTKFVSALAFAGMMGTSAASTLRSFDNYSYDNFLQEFKGGFKNAFQITEIGEYLNRKQVFEKNIALIKKHNEEYQRGEHQWFMNVNAHADLTTTEFLSRYTGYDKPSAATGLKSIDNLLTGKAQTMDELPTSVDNSQYLSPTKNQGRCGSCWAFAATTAMEASVAFFSKTTPPVLSTQAFTSCTPNTKKCGGTGGCSGSTAQLAYDWAKTVSGIPTEADYPYISGTTTKTETCNFHGSEFKPAARLVDYFQIPSNDKIAHMSAVAAGHVLTVSVAATGMHFYGGGIYDACSTGKYVTDDEKYPESTVNHLVVLYGYDDESWLVRNSWGETWGNGGNIRMAKRKGSREVCYQDNKWSSGSGCEGESEDIIGCGECLILIDSTLPLAKLL